MSPGFDPNEDVSAAEGLGIGHGVLLAEVPGGDRARGLGHFAGERIGESELPGGISAQFCGAGTPAKR